MKTKYLPYLVLVLVVIGILQIVVPDFNGAIVGPFFWVFSIWEGDPNLPLHDQIPGFGSANNLGIWSAYVAGTAVLIYIGGYIFHRPHYAKRIALILMGLAWYLYLVSSPMTYSYSRQIIGISAFICIFCARLLKRWFKPIKTVLFFIGIGFTSEALAWALADPKATIISSALFALISAFFTRIDEKRKHKTRVCTALGLMVFIISLGIYIEAPLWVKIITIAFGATRIIHSIHIYGRPEGSNVTTFESNPAGLTNICFPHIEVHGEQGSRIVYHSPELRVTDNPSTHLTMFKIASVFGDKTSVLLGFGTPNAAVSVYDDDAGTWKRLSAFMFFRHKSKVSNLDELQVGLYFEIRGLSSEIRMRLLDEMKKGSGVRNATCAHATAKVLANAGFSIGSQRAVNIKSSYRPSHLASLIWRFGLTHDGKEVDVRIVNTSKLDVRDHLVGVWKKELMSPIRMIEKIIRGKKPLARPIHAQNQDVTIRENQTWVGVPVIIRLTRANTIGSLLTLLWGWHPEFRVLVHGLQIHPDLSTPLVAFPGDLSLISKVKKYFLFSRPVIYIINKVKIRDFDQYNDVPVGAAIEMMSPASAEEERVLWNFAVIAVDDTYEFRLSPLKNQDPKSKDSKMRKAANWILAKHVVATGYNENTVFAGEGYVNRDVANDQLTICINNNSGTYKPSLQQLEITAQMIRGFGVEVQTQVQDNTQSPLSES